MAKKVLSIVIGAEITKICEVSYKKNYKNKGIKVYHSITFPTPANMIEDGYIKDKVSFAQQLRARLKQAKIRSKRVIFSIASSKIANREVIIPLVRESRIADIIKTGASEYFPVDMNDYVLSHIILEKKTSDRKEKAEAKNLARQEAAQAKKQAKQERKAAKKNKSYHAGEANPVPAVKLRFSEEETQPQEAMPSDTGYPQQEEKKDNGNRKDKIGKKHIRLSVYAVPSTLVKNYYNFADIMELELVSIDYSGNSSYQMLKRQVNEGVNVFIQLNEQDTVVSILKDNVLVLQRTIGYGVSTLIETVLEQKCFDVWNEKEAMELLIKRNLLESGPRKTVTPENRSIDTHKAAAASLDSSREEAAVALEPALAEEAERCEKEEYQAKLNVVESLLFLINSVSRMLDYYKNNNRNVEYKTIYLSGYGIRIQGIDQLFSQHILIDNKKLEKLSTVNSSKKAKEYRTCSSEFLSCVGAVINPVNFVPRELVIRRQRIEAVVAGAFLILISMGASGLLGYIGYTDVRTARADYEAAQQQLAALPGVSGIKEEYETSTRQLEDLERLENAATQEEKLEEVLAQLKANLLSNSVITSIQFTQNGVTMNILMADSKYGANTLVAKLLSQLKTIELFDDVQDSNLVVGEDGQISLVVTCTYR